MGVEFAWVETEQKLAFYEAQYVDRILAPCNYCLHPSCVDHKSYHNTLLIMFSCDGISDHASWNEVFHYCKGHNREDMQADDYLIIPVHIGTKRNQTSVHAFDM